MSGGRTIGLMLLATAFTSSPAEASEIAACEAAMHGAAERHDVPLGVLYAVGLTETGRRDSLHPFALNVEGRSFFEKNLDDALDRFRQARAGGAKLIDVGCMQINHYYHAEAFASVEAMFEPAANVDYAARFLKRLRSREGNWTMAVARYHAGPHNDPAQKRYVCRVIENLVASEFGRWTPGARRFCDG